MTPVCTAMRRTLAVSSKSIHSNTSKRSIGFSSKTRGFPASQFVFSVSALAAGAVITTYVTSQSKEIEGRKSQEKVPVLDLGISKANPQVPSDDEITRLLNEEAYACKVDDIEGVKEYHGTRTQASSPCEDRFVHGKFSAPWGEKGKQWMAWGVFDGHLGWQMSQYLSENLVPCVRDELSRVSPVEAGETIKQAFVKLDNSIMDRAAHVIHDPLSFREKAAQLALAYAGSCALLSLYDPETRNLQVACTGDSRAVLGERQPDGTWKATALSVDQSGSAPLEIARLNAEHPNEPEMIKGGRVHGIMVSRAFGDGGWKWDAATQEIMHEKYNGRRAYHLKSPPYLTARPEVTTTKIKPGKQCFLIMATDWMWDTMSSEQAVNLVGRWLDWKAQGSPPQAPNTTDFGPFDLSTYHGSMWQLEDKKLALQDKNAAVHLMRNALGGRHQDMIKGAFIFTPPLARSVRDDITIQVVMFD